MFIRCLIARRSATVLCAAGLLATNGFAQQPVYEFGLSDADTVLLVGDQPGSKNAYWWDHPNLTVTVVSSPNVDPAKLQAIHTAIQIWSRTLSSWLPQVSLTNVSGSDMERHADIVVHYVPNSGGVVNGGMAACGVQRCLNVQIRSEEPPGGPYADFDTTRVLRETLHEIGHALGLGHAQPLLTSRDIMGYGWAMVTPNAVPIISECDLKGIRAAFAWLLAGQPPHRPVVTSVSCMR